ncbi:uncharacterized protein DMAD_11495 [Drosophila madeirensis]|uniref:Uncharacterized protein n=1 Tax=Drosophila madeirensis TaxID=30013 RepID=A0AAU9FDD5_DROMD
MYSLTKAITTTKNWSISRRVSIKLTNKIQLLKSPRGDPAQRPQDQVIWQRQTRETLAASNGYEQQQTVCIPDLLCNFTLTSNGLYPRHRPPLCCIPLQPTKTKNLDDIPA